MFGRMSGRGNLPKIICDFILVILYFGSVAEAAVTVGKITVIHPLAQPIIGQVSIPIAGFAPQVVMGMTDANSGDSDWSAVYEPSLVGTPWPNAGSPYYTIAMLDTGADGNLLSRADRAGFALPDTGFTAELQGAGSATVTADIMTPAGFFADGLQALTGPSSPPNTGGFKGTSNVEGIGARMDDQDLPTVLGFPTAAYYTTVIRNNQVFAGSYNGKVYNSPGVSFYNSQLDPGVPSVDYRFHATFDVPEYLPPTYSPDFGFGLAAPTVSPAMLLSANVTNLGRSGSGSFLFDTGAQITVISQTIAKFDLNLDLTHPDFTVEVSGIGGTAQEPGFYIDNFTLPASGLGNFSLPHVPVVVMDVPSATGGTLDGIVGMNLFTDRSLVVAPDYAGGSSWGQPFVGITSVVRLAGDANLDGQVTFEDFSALQNHYGRSGISWLDGDFNYDGMVTFEDFSILQNHYGQTLAAGVAAVPEPTMMVLLGAGSLSLLRRRPPWAKRR